MNNSNYRTANSNKTRNKKQTIEMQTDLSDIKNHAKNQFMSDKKCPLSPDKMAEILSLLRVIIVSIEKLEGDFGADNSNSITLKILENLLLADP